MTGLIATIVYCKLSYATASPICQLIYNVAVVETCDTEGSEPPLSLLLVSFPRTLKVTTVGLFATSRHGEHTTIDFIQTHQAD